MVKLLYVWYFYLNWSNQTQFVSPCCCFATSVVVQLANFDRRLGERGEGIHVVRFSNWLESHREWVGEPEKLRRVVYMKETTVTGTIATFGSTGNPHIIKVQAWQSFPQWLSCSIIKRERVWKGDQIADNFWKRPPWPFEVCATQQSVSSMMIDLTLAPIHPSISHTLRHMILLFMTISTSRSLDGEFSGWVELFVWYCT